MQYNKPPYYQSFPSLVVDFIKAIGIISICILATLLFTKQATAQANINYVEYYLDQDPGIGNATPLSITPATTITNATFTVDVNALSLGVHILGSRARTTAGVWSMGHHWFIFKPYIAIVPAAAATITRVEYFIDQDPGIGAGTAINIGTPSSNLSDFAFNINATTLSAGTHIVGTRALSSNGNWSKTSFWLFYNPFSNLTPTTAPQVSRVEYFIDQDPGLGAAISIPFTPSTNVADIAFSPVISSLSAGTHLVGARARDAGGSWSFTNYWLFVKPFTPTVAAATPNVTALEYFLDYDPGVGNGTPITITAGTNLVDQSFSINITSLITGDHFVVVRARDANGNWSKVNNWAFNKPGTPPTMSTLVSTTTFCAGATLNVGYQLSSAIALNANNQFIAQLSDISGSFANPTILGSVTSTNNTTNSFTCTIPANTVQSSSYRIRVISTSQAIVGSNNGANITIYSLPNVPAYVTPLADTTVCQNNTLRLETNTVSAAYQWLLNGNAIANATSNALTIPNFSTANAGAYSLRLNNYSSATCNVVTPVRNISINTNVASIPTLSPSGAIGVCLGSARTLTSSSATNNRWLKDGVVISGATAATYNVTLPGIYTVETTNGSGCYSASSNNAVVTVGLAATQPTIVAGGPTTFCQNQSVNLTSSAFNGNQWFRNGQLISGQTAQALSVTTSGYYKTLVSGGGCEVLSDSVLVTVNANVSPTVVLTAPGTIVPNGTPLTFTATPANGGTNPQYAFYVNNMLAQSGSSNTYTAPSFTNASSVYTTLTSNANCASPTTANSNTLSISIAANVNASGRIATPTGILIPAATVRVSGGMIDSMVTDANSRYNFSLFQQRNYTLSPYKNNDVVKANGVNVLDVLQMQNHILNRSLLNTPYKIIAADANGDNAVNILDVIAVRRLILGIDTTFAGNRLWVFIDSLYTFPNATNPFPYSNSRTLSNITTSNNAVSFYGVKLGDVTQDWAPVQGQNRLVSTRKPLQLYYDTLIADKGETIRVKLRVKNCNDIMGMQFSLGFDKQIMNLLTIENKRLPIEHSLINVDKGIINFIWADANNTPQTLVDGTVLFELVLYKKATSAATDISIVNGFTPAMAFARGNEGANVEKTTGIILDKLPATPIVAVEKMMVTPNPSKGTIQVMVASKANKKATLFITDVNGKTVYTKVVALIAGNNFYQVNMREQKALAPGMYHVNINGLEAKATETVLLMNE